MKCHLVDYPGHVIRQPRLDEGLKKKSKGMGEEKKKKKETGRKKKEKRKVGQ